MPRSAAFCGGVDFRHGGARQALAAPDIDRASPINSAMVVSTSKYTSLLIPIRPTSAQLPWPGNSRYQRAQNQRSHDHADQPQENVAEDAQVFGKVRPVQTDFSAEQHREENPVGQ